MPLVTGKKATTEKGFARNIKTEMSRGYPKKQAVAIAYGEAGRAKKEEMHKDKMKKMKHEDVKMDKKLIESTLKKVLKKECFK